MPHRYILPFAASLKHINGGGTIMVQSSGCGRRPAAIAETQPGAGMKEGRTMKEHRSGRWTPGLSEAEKATLFAIARETLKWAVEGRRGAFDFGRYALTPLLKAETATFVTLKIKGHLRGCIGSLSPTDPLYLSVHENAINAALSCLLYTSPSPRDRTRSRMPSSA